MRACAISSSDIFTAVGIMMILFECYGCIILHFNHICNQKFYLVILTNTGFMTMNSLKELLSDENSGSSYSRKTWNTHGLQNLGNFQSI